MTDRALRLHRLVTLREKQHDATVAALQSAHMQLRTAEAAVAQAEAAARAAHNASRAAVITGSTGDWMIASAEAELYRVTVSQRQVARTQAGAAVHTAAQHEANARRDRKQMETTLDRLQSQYQIESARAEQRTLDEAARLLKSVAALRAGGRHSAF